MNRDKKGFHDVGNEVAPSSLLLALFLSWTIISIGLIITSINTNIPSYWLLLIGSILSIFGSSLILTSCVTHYRQVRSTSFSVTLRRNISLFTR